MRKKDGIHTSGQRWECWIVEEARCPYRPLTSRRPQAWHSFAAPGRFCRLCVSARCSTSRHRGYLLLSPHARSPRFSIC